jgi:cytochrome c
LIPSVGSLFSMKLRLIGILGVLAIGSSLTVSLSASPKAGDAAKGKETFEQCAVCHNVDTDERKMGPSLKGLFKREKLASGKKVTEENVKATINAGGNGMPSYQDMLSDEEKDNVIAYLKTL